MQRIMALQGAAMIRDGWWSMGANKKWAPKEKDRAKHGAARCHTSLDGLWPRGLKYLNVQQTNSVSCKKDIPYRKIPKDSRITTPIQLISTRFKSGHRIGRAARTGRYGSRTSAPQPTGVAHYGCTMTMVAYFICPEL